MNARALPVGFRENAAGLIVPDALSRVREVWTYAEWRVLERATKLLTSRHVRFQFACSEPGCEARMERVRNADGGITLRCAHKDRVFARGI